MKKIASIISILFGFIIIAFVGWFLFSLGQFVLSLDTDLGKAIITGCFTILAAVTGVLISKHIEEKNKILYDIRQKKIPIYEKLIAFYMRIANANKSGAKPSNKDISKFMEEFTSNLIVWGSDGVIDAWVKARTLSLEDEAADSIRILALFEQLMLEIRKDLGHKNKNIDKNHALLSTFINDLSKHTADLNKFNERS